MCHNLLNASIKKNVRGAEARHTHARIHRQHRGTEIVSGVRLFLCEENRSFLTISPPLLHKPHQAGCTCFLCSWPNEARQPFLCWPLWSDTSLLLSQDGGNTLTEGSQPIVTPQRQEEQSSRFMCETARSQYITPAALPLHYGNTIHTHRPAATYRPNFHTENVWLWEAPASCQVMWRWQTLKCLPFCPRSCSEGNTWTLSF